MLPVCTNSIISYSVILTLRFAYSNFLSALTAADIVCCRFKIVFTPSYTPLPIPTQLPSCPGPDPVPVPGSMSRQVPCRVPSFRNGICLHAITSVGTELGSGGQEWVTGCPNFMPLVMATACCISNQFSLHVLWRITKMKLNLGWPKTLLKSFSRKKRQDKQNKTKQTQTEQN